MKALTICPTYARIPFLNRMVAGFLSQTYDDKELVIVNDDKNVELVCDQPGVVCINLNKRILVPQKKNLAIGLGYHDVFLTCDDDDVYLPNHIESHVKKHLENPDIGLYRNDAAYTIYGDHFSIAHSPPNTISCTRSAWFLNNGFAYDQNIGEDQEFYYKVPNKLVERDESNISYVYNWGGINYHLTCESDSSIEEKAFNQLQQLNLVGKKYHIEPDFEQYENFKKLDQIYKSKQENLLVKHVELGKIDISHLTDV